MKFTPIDDKGQEVLNWDDSRGWVLTIADNGKFYFWDECQQGPYGPYSTAEECQAGLEDYVKKFLLQITS